MKRARKSCHDKAARVFVANIRREALIASVPAEINAQDTAWPTADPKALKMAESIALRLFEQLSSRPQIGPRHVLWDAKACAAYLSVSYTHFRGRVAPCPSFPKPFRLPSSMAGSGIDACRWIAGEVTQWAHGGE